LATVGAEVTNATATTTGSVTDYEKEAA